MSNVPEELKYTEEHEWVKVDGDTAIVGITDFAQSSLGDIVFVELPDSDTEVQKDSTFGVVESIKSVSDLYVPVSGSVIEKNSAAEDAPESINESPYGTWLIKIKVSDTSEIDGLLDSSAYKAFCDKAN
jgi:glycine cleavage system H protein